MFRYKLKKAMDEKGMNQIELSTATGISKGSISQYLSGYSQPKKENLETIAKVLDVTPAYLLGFDEKPREEKETLITTKSGKEINVTESFVKMFQAIIDKAMEETINSKEGKEIMFELMEHDLLYNDLTDEELKKLNEYAKFLKSQRKEPPQE